MITHDNTCLHEKNAPLPSFCKESYGPQDIPENSPPVLIRGGFFASASEAVNQPWSAQNMLYCWWHLAMDIHGPSHPTSCVDRWLGWWSDEWEVRTLYIYIYGFGVNRRGLDELTHSQMTSQLLWYFDPDKQIPRNTYVSAGQETSTVESGSLVATVAMGGSKWGEVHWFEWCYVKSFYIWHRLYLQFDFVWFICYSRWQLNVGSM